MVVDAPRPVIHFLTRYASSGGFVPGFHTLSGKSAIYPLIYLSMLCVFCWPCPPMAADAKKLDVHRWVRSPCIQFGSWSPRTFRHIPKPVFFNTCPPHLHTLKTVFFDPSSLCRVRLDDVEPVKHSFQHRGGHLPPTCSDTDIYIYIYCICTKNKYTYIRVDCAGWNPKVNGWCPMLIAFNSPASSSSLGVWTF